MQEFLLVYPKEGCQDETIEDLILKGKTFFQKTLKNRHDSDVT